MGARGGGRLDAWPNGGYRTDKIAGVLSSQALEQVTDPECSQGGYPADEHHLDS